MIDPIINGLSILLFFMEPMETAPISFKRLHLLLLVKGYFKNRKIEFIQTGSKFILTKIDTAVAVML